ncbi:ERF family protein [Streptomyces niveiscabiei]|uniref:ERF family protein n=1 Tax=Streptomyces niveiscabiei TaxID=164115 RepID=A0ABW9I0K7_9ACTN
MTVTTLHPNQPAPAPALAPVAAVPPAPRMETAYVPAPVGAPEGTPRIFQVIHGVMRDVMPVAKGQHNQQQNYAFRGVDDAMSAMAGPMRNHGCFIAPEVIEHRQRPRGEKGTHTVVKMLFRIFGPAGDCLLVSLPGEAMDMADKSTNKAMSAALKYMLFQVFMIPIDARSIDDGDRETPIMDNAPRQQGGQRQQQRRGGQQRQREQQPRRNGRAEQGPREQAPAQQQAGPRRDYLAEARTAQDPEAFAKVRADAVAAGAPADYLAQLDQVDAEKRRAAQQATPKGEQAPPPNPPADPEAAAAEAENALRLAASRANLPTLDADFERVYGLPIEQAPAAHLDAFRAMIENGGAR